MINVTKTFLPPQAEYQAILKQAWDTGWMTNRGVLVKALESRLQAYLDVPNVIAMTNGTLPLQIAIKGLGLSGEIITTPFSYVATTSSIVWEGCTPVFVDIHPDYLTIDETQIEDAITERTTAILATHVFGNPCDVEAIEAIAKRHDLNVIYDAAHCFGVRYKGQSVFNYGDVSTCSFHATKLFHTGEGGALFCQPEYYEQLYWHHNFGHDGPDVFRGLGINAKMSELQAAMGLSVLPYMAEILSARAAVVTYYEEYLKDLPLQFLKLRSGTEWNYSYFPVVFRSETELLRVKSALEVADVYARRYFYPSLDQLPYIDTGVCLVSNTIAKCVLCLPLFVGMRPLALDKIVGVIRKVLS